MSERELTKWVGPDLDGVIPKNAEIRRLEAENAALLKIAEAAKALAAQVETVFVVNPHERIEGLGQIDALLAKFDAALAEWEDAEGVRIANSQNEQLQRVVREAVETLRAWAVPVPTALAEWEEGQGGS